MCVLLFRRSAQRARLRRLLQRMLRANLKRGRGARGGGAMRIKTAFSFRDYAKIAAMGESDFAQLGEHVSIGKFDGESYTYVDNGSAVLGVAHLDTVQDHREASIIRVNGERVLLSPVLDDRLGVYIITRLLPRLGIVCDWLLTTGEEIGQSSAELFNAKKAYNWAFSFDRSGTDVVLYHYEHKALKRLLRRAGFKIGNGTFSDLSFLNADCSGINFGCGYHSAHSPHAYAILSETFSMVGKFRQFWHAFKNVRLPYKKRSPYTRWDRGYLGGERYYCGHS